MLAEPERLNDSARSALADTGNEGFVSVASIWKIGIKHELGKLILPVALDTLVTVSRERFDLQVLSIGADHALVAPTLPPHHKDPFDRMLVAQALVEGLTPAASPAGYADWLTEVKARVHAAQQRAALAVNSELLRLYWQLGHDIRDRQAREGWAAGVVDQVSADLRAAFPDMKGFSRVDFVQQSVGQLPWPAKVGRSARLS
jgi:PIN domain nuclease of toxin-antitoxin system